MSKIIRVAGLDPALANFGMARMLLNLETLDLKLEKIETMVTEPMAGKRKVIRRNSDDLRRATDLHNGMHKFMAGCSFAFGEIPTGTQGQRAALGFGIAIGVLASCKVPLIEVMPLETKMGSVGVKTAGKPEIIAWAADLYPDAGWKTYARDESRGKVPKKKGDLHLDNEHAADAVAIVHAGIQTPEFKRLLTLLYANAAN